MKFAPTELTEPERALQAEVREFLAAELPPGSYPRALGMGAGNDPEFSKKLAARGWVGMALPKEYGGHDRTAVDRFIVVEELLSHGAPIGYHWVADRQTGSIINRFGTEEQRERFLPPICRGELGFSIGMSEPDSGSDLASVSTRATRTDGGWLLNGTKVWTSGAHENDWFVVLCRTAPLEDGHKHQGLSQLLVDLTSPGLEINGIPFLDGSPGFNEVVMSDVFVPDELVLGELGMGWAQNTSELAYERGGPDRWLSTFGIVEEFLRLSEGTPLGDRAAEMLGWATSRWWALRNLSLSVARLIDEGQAPSVESSLVKEMGTRFEQDVLQKVIELVDLEPSPESASLFERLVAAAVQTGPSFTIRGGTIEILRSVASKGLGRG
ncbi:MAG: acyl-CoA dehydrogenase family protein [Acidimicrobiia bacterium]|nr:acyl-CoA dehydrogenase family protein [Acidimicrobiia bacterium]